MGRIKKYRQILDLLTGAMSISGNTARAAEEIIPKLEGYFDECRVDAVGNIYLTKASGREGAPHIMLCAHMDEVGMMVTGIEDGGFLRVTNIGGIDTRILQAADVYVYGSEIVRGVVGSTPPHLQSPGDADKLKKIDELIIDTGYDLEELEKIVKIGAPVGYASGTRELLGNIISGRGFDDKCCAASAILSVAETPREKLCFDVTVVLSAFEETAYIGGAAVAAYSADPDLALVLDVDFGNSPALKDKEGILKLGDGASVIFSSVTSRKFTKAIVKLAAHHGIKLQACVSAGRLGTDGEVVSVSRSGIATVNLGVPLRNMHTYTEVISIDDTLALTDIISAVMCDETIAKEARI